MRKILVLLLMLSLSLVCCAVPSMAVTFSDGQYVRLGYAAGSPTVWSFKALPGMMKRVFLGAPVTTTSFGTSSTWTGSSLAQYLNGTYLSGNFSSEEIAALTPYGTTPLYNASVSNTASTKTISPTSAGDSLVWIMDVQEIQALYVGSATAVFDDITKDVSRAVYAAGGPFWTRSPVAGDTTKVWKINTDGTFAEELVTTVPISVVPVVSVDVSKMLFKTGVGTQPSPYTVTYRWETTPMVTVSGDTVTIEFAEAITSFNSTWPALDAFLIIDNAGASYSVSTVTPTTDGKALALKISPVAASGKEFTIKYSQRFDNETSGLNNTKGAILRSANNRFAFSCATLTGMAGSDSAPKITTTTPQQFKLATATSLDLAATGGTMPYTWSVVTGSLPSGLTLSTGGKISGTASTAGTYSVTIQVQDAAGQKTQKMFSFVVGGASGDLTIFTTLLPTAGTGQYYTEMLIGSGGTKPYSWKMSGAPDWLSLDSTTGVLTGTPLYSGTHSLTVTLSDDAGATATKTLRLMVGEHDGLTIETRVLEAARYNKEYSMQLEASGGTPPYLFTVRSGYSLPHGLSLSSTGLLSGKASRKAAYDFVLDVMDGGNLKGSAVFSMVIMDDSAMNPSGSDFKASDNKDAKTIKIGFWLPKEFNFTEILAVEALTSPAGYIETSSSELQRESNGAWKVELTLYASDYVLREDDVDWTTFMEELYFDGFTVKFQNCSGETVKFGKPLLIRQLKGDGGGSGGCDIGLGFAVLVVAIGASWGIRKGK